MKTGSFTDVHHLRIAMNLAIPTNIERSIEILPAAHFLQNVGYYVDIVLYRCINEHRISFTIIFLCPLEIFGVARVLGEKGIESHLGKNHQIGILAGGQFNRLYTPVSVSFPVFSNSRLSQGDSQ
jgi:hypothetical protein